MNKLIFTLYILSFTVFCCKAEDNSSLNDDNTIETSDESDTPDESDEDDENDSSVLRILSLGNSYTIGTGVCETCSYPKQLKDSLTLNSSIDNDIELNIIAAAGWTTTSLLNALNSIETEYTYDLVTLLIGVNNQFQHLPFNIYQEEFQDLISRAILEGRNDTSNVVVISIPDYTFTPFGQSTGNPENNSEEIDIYNEFAQTFCEQNNITYLYITDISREGLNNPDLIADDDLHLSELAYSLITERLMQIALEKLN